MARASAYLYETVEEPGEVQFLMDIEDRGEVGEVAPLSVNALMHILSQVMPPVALHALAKNVGLAPRGDFEEPVPAIAGDAITAMLIQKMMERMTPPQIAPEPESTESSKAPKITDAVRITLADVLGGVLTMEITGMADYEIGQGASPVQRLADRMVDCLRKIGLVSGPIAVPKKPSES